MVVQRQIGRLPPELREQFRQRDADLPGSNGNATLPGSFTSPVGLQPPAGTGQILAQLGPRLPPDPLRPSRSPGNRARYSLRDVGESLRWATFVSVLVGLLLAFLLARQVARPISAVSEAAVRVAAGDLSARACSRATARPLSWRAAST